MKQWHADLVRPLATVDTPGAFYRGLRGMGMDGTVFDVPDRPVLEEAFGRPTGGKPSASSVQPAVPTSHLERLCTPKGSHP